MKREKRLHPRFRIKDDVFAVLRPDFARIGRVRDISEGGFSMEYLEDDLQYPETARVDIFCNRGSLYIGEIPCRLVYDRPGRDQAVWTFAGLVQQQCGYRFEALEGEKAEQLRVLIANHTEDQRGAIRASR